MIALNSRSRLAVVNVLYAGKLKCMINNLLVDHRFIISFHTTFLDHNPYDTRIADLTTGHSRYCLYVDAGNICRYIIT